MKQEMMCAHRLDDRLFTGVLLYCVCADFAFHLATPLEFAVASFFHNDCSRVIASAAAKDRATVQPCRGLVTDSAVSS